MTFSADPAQRSEPRGGRLAFAFAMMCLGFGIAGLTLPVWPNVFKIETLATQQARAERIALALAAHQLHAAVLAGAPYANELDLVKALGRSDPEIGPQLTLLEPAQKTGIASIRRLVGEFEQIAARVLIEESTSPDANWFGQTMGRISALSVALMMEARVNPFKSQAAPSIKEMQIALTEGDFARALAQLGEMPEPARAPFAPWRRLVDIRIDAIAAANRIAARAARVAAQ